MKAVGLFSRLVLAAVLAIGVAPAHAQQPIEPGTAVEGKPTQRDEPDLFVFVGGVGDTVTFELAGSGPVALTLFTSEGDPMLSADGDDRARLEAVLPLTDAYMVAVSRGSADSAYRLAMTSATPDLHLAIFATGVGYAYEVNRAGRQVTRRKCWVEPGVVYQRWFDDTVEYDELARGGRELTYLASEYPKAPDMRRQVTFEGDRVLYVDTYRDGDISSTELPLTGLRFSREEYSADKTNLRYAGYMCD